MTFPTIPDLPRQRECNTAALLHSSTASAEDMASTALATTH